MLGNISYTYGCIIKPVW